MGTVYKANCGYCSYETYWYRDKNMAVGEITGHIETGHEGQSTSNYTMREKRACDYCFNDRIRTCLGCGHDYCTEHAGLELGYCNQCRS